MRFMLQPPKSLLFTGKGGVGKTSLACMAAVKLADDGKRVLLVSTDPASNLDEVLGVALASRPRSIPGLPCLHAMNIDPEVAAREYRERTIAPYRGLLPQSAINSMEEQLSGSCTVEIAAFDEFTRLLGDPAATSDFDHVIFDTAPTGHTLRLLSLPSAWNGFLDNNTTGTSCLGPLSGLTERQSVYRKTVDELGNPQQTLLVLVCRPEGAALREAGRTSKELLDLGIENQHLVVNGCFTSQDSTDPVAVAMQARAEEALRSIPESLQSIPQTHVPLSPEPLLGIDSFRRCASGKPGDNLSIQQNTSVSTTLQPLGELIDELAEKPNGVIMTMGKGGVGKTTVASAIAIGLAERGFHVHLSTTDPAAHVAETVAEKFVNLRVTRIDPVAEVKRYSEAVLKEARDGLDPQGLAMLKEDLRSPCTEEIAVFRAFAQLVATGEQEFVVLDTAPTGHTILLLDAAQAYHHELERQTSESTEEVRSLLPRLRNPDLTRVLLVTLLEATPVHEAAVLQSDLRRAGIEPFAWVVNQCLTPWQIIDPVLSARRNTESVYIEEVVNGLADRVVCIPWKLEPPVGVERLSQLARETLT